MYWSATWTLSCGGIFGFQYSRGISTLNPSQKPNNVSQLNFCYKPLKHASHVGKISANWFHCKLLRGVYFLIIFLSVGYCCTAQYRNSCSDWVFSAALPVLIILSSLPHPFLSCSTNRFMCLTSRLPRLNSSDISRSLDRSSYPFRSKCFAKSSSDSKASRVKSPSSLACNCARPSFQKTCDS